MKTLVSDSFEIKSCTGKIIIIFLHGSRKWFIVTSKDDQAVIFVYLIFTDSELWAKPCTLYRLSFPHITRKRLLQNCCNGYSMPIWGPASNGVDRGERLFDRFDRTNRRRFYRPPCRRSYRLLEARKELRKRHGRPHGHTSRNGRLYRHARCRPRTRSERFQENASFSFIGRIPCGIWLPIFSRGKFTYLFQLSTGREIFIGNDQHSLSSAHHRRATCYKMFTADLLKSIPLDCEGFEFCPEVTAKVSRLGYKIKEVPIRYYPRSIEEGKNCV